MKYELFNSLRTKNNLLSLGMKIKLLVKFRDQNSIYFTLNYNMITIHTHVTNPLYFLIIKLYKVILYLYYTRIHSHK